MPEFLLVDLFSTALNLLIFVFDFAQLRLRDISLRYSRTSAFTLN